MFSIAYALNKSFGQADGPKDGLGSLLVLHIRKTYEVDHTKQHGSNVDESQETLDHSSVSEAMRESAKSTSGFTTRLDGRLAADDENPWLMGFHCECRGGGATIGDAQTADW